MAMAQGADGNAATITGPNGQQQPAYYVQQPVYLDQNGQPVYYRVGESLRVQLILCFFNFLLFFFSFLYPFLLFFSFPLFFSSISPTSLSSIFPFSLLFLSFFLFSHHDLSYHIPANQNGQYQQQDGPMIYGVPTQQEVGNPLGDPLQVSYLPYNPTQSQSMGNQTGYWAPQGQGKIVHLTLLF